MNAIDKGATDRGEFTLTCRGCRFRISPLPVSSKGFPFKNIVWLRRWPSFGVKWYSSLVNGLSDAVLPTHDTVLLRPFIKELPLWSDLSSVFMLIIILFRTLRLKFVLLLRLIRSRVRPACDTEGKSQEMM